ncbi:MAG: acetyl-CoA carboxylase biotin carboxyl carrier protein [bacterium]
MGMINEEALKRMIELVEASQIDELEISRWGTRIRITRRRGREATNGSAGSQPEIAPAVAPRAVVESSAVPPAPSTEPAEGHIEIRSPMVGTFYAAASPGEAPFVNLNDRVASGQLVCIIEAMKLMNEIHAEVSGRVAKLLVTNGQPVEYNQPLFLIDTKG